MKTKILRVFTAVLLLSLLAVMLVSCTNLDRAATRLTEAGYKVTRLGEGADGVYADAADEDVEATVTATAGPSGEWLTIIRFKEKETAEEFYRLQSTAYQSTYFMTVVKDGRTVIYGWSAAYDIIK